MNVLVLGVGNILFSDEGVGPWVVKQLEDHYIFPAGVVLIDGGTSAMELLEDMAAAELLIIVDAVRTGKPPGSLVVIENDDLPRFFTQKVSPHQVGLCDVLATLQISGESPAETVIIGVEPASFETGMTLSPTVDAAMGAVQQEVLRRLAVRGVVAERRLAVPA